MRTIAAGPAGCAAWASAFASTFVVSLTLAAASVSAFAQWPPSQQTEAPATQRGGVFIEPPRSVDPVYLPAPRSASPYQPAPSAGFTPLQARLSLDVPLRGGSGVVGFRSQGAKAASPTLQADLRWQPFENAYWFAQATFYRYLNGDRQQPWNPDWSYSFGYEDWHPGTWSLVYSNYTGTRAHPDRSLGQGRANFSEGVWALSYRFDLPESLQPWFLVGDGDAASCRAGAQLTPRFTDLATQSVRSNRTAVTLGCRYTRPDGWFIEATALAYPQRRKQQPWDPDFIYAFGFADYRPGTFSLQYSNYSGNRWPWRARGPGEGTPRSGSITLSWQLGW